MTDRTPTPLPQAPSLTHPMRDILALDVMIPSQIALFERMFDRIEKGSRS